jgi:hypothetical protein
MLKILLLYMLYKIRCQNYMFSKGLFILFIFRVFTSVALEQTERERCQDACREAIGPVLCTWPPCPNPRWDCMIDYCEAKYS